MQTMAIRTVAKSLPENEAILLTLLISRRYIPYTDLRKNDGINERNAKNRKNGGGKGKEGAYANLRAVGNKCRTRPQA